MTAYNRTNVKIQLYEHPVTQELPCPKWDVFEHSYKDVTNSAIFPQTVPANEELKTSLEVFAIRNRFVAWWDIEKAIDAVVFEKMMSPENMKCACS